MQVRPVRMKSDRTIKAIAYLLSIDRAATASELAQVMGLPTRRVYPQLKYAINAGVVRVTKAGHDNLYSIPKSLRQYVMKLTTRFRRAEDVVRLALEARGIKVEAQDLRLLVEVIRRLASRSRGWVGGWAEDFIDELAAALKSGRDDVVSGLRALAMKGVLLVYNRVKGIAKVKLADGWAHLVHVV